MFCIDCKHYRPFWPFGDGPFHVCARAIEYKTDYVLGGAYSTDPALCYDLNQDGECPNFEQEEELPPLATCQLCKFYLPIWENKGYRLCAALIDKLKFPLSCARLNLGGNCDYYKEKDA